MGEEERDNLAQLRRRRGDGDTVTYREMVEHTSRALEDFHTVRAESVRQLEARLADIADRVEKQVDRLTTEWQGHSDWHRDQLQRALSTGSDRRLALAGLLVAAMSVGLLLVGLLVNHWK